MFQDRKTIEEILTGAFLETEQTIFGWVRTRRESKEVFFLLLNDGSCLSGIQVVFPKDRLSPEVVSGLTTGTSCRIKGRIVASTGGGQALEMQGEALKILGESPALTYPLQKKNHSFEFLRDIAHLRPRTNTFGAVFRVRSRISYAIHRFFQDRGFFYIATPLITANDAEGAGQMFQVTTLPLGKEGNPVDYSQDFFGQKVHLSVSGQLNLESFACSLGKVYSFGPIFRAENSNTTRHAAEFWMIEAEMAFMDLEGNKKLAEDMIKFLIADLLENCSEDMAFFDKWIEPGLRENLKKILEKPFVHLTYTKAVEDLQKSGQKFDFPVIWGIDLQTEHERFLTEKLYQGPLIVTDYPKDIKAFYMKQNEDGKTVRGMDILVPRLGEIMGGSEREDNLALLEQRLRDLGAPMEPYDWYLDLRRYGTVAHSGFGLGLERFVQYVTGMQNIRDVLPFPRTPGQCKF